ncbi:MAG: hypothetical protein ACFWUC_13450 [Oscillospiraceae bacterium]|jgi:hypothetical protein
MADKKDKRVKELVEEILIQQGRSYDEWLYQTQMEFIAENSDIVLSALQRKGDE